MKFWDFANSISRGSISNSIGTGNVSRISIIWLPKLHMNKMFGWLQVKQCNPRSQAMKGLKWRNIEVQKIVSQKSSTKKFKGNFLCLGHLVGYSYRQYVFWETSNDKQVFHFSKGALHAITGLKLDQKKVWPKLSDHLFNDCPSMRCRIYQHPSEEIEVASSHSSSANYSWMLLTQVLLHSFKSPLISKGKVTCSWIYLEYLTTRDLNITPIHRCYYLLLCQILRRNQAFPFNLPTIGHVESFLSQRRIQ